MALFLILINICVYGMEKLILLLLGVAEVLAEVQQLEAAFGEVQLLPLLLPLPLEDQLLEEVQQVDQHLHPQQQVGLVLQQQGHQHQHAQTQLHSGMVQNVYHAICLNIGTMTPIDVKIAHLVLIMISALKDV